MRQLRIQYDENKLLQIAKDMKAKGLHSLKVEKDKLGVKSLEFLSNYDHLEELALYGISRNIEVVSKLINLKIFVLASLKTKNLKFLESVKKLENLTLQGVKLDDWSSVSLLKNLNSIHLFNLRIDDFTFVSELENLQIAMIFSENSVQ